MLQGKHSAILLTFIMLPFIIKIFVLSIFEWPFYPGFTVYKLQKNEMLSTPVLCVYKQQTDQGFRCFITEYSILKE